MKQCEEERDHVQGTEERVWLIEQAQSKTELSVYHRVSINKAKKRKSELITEVLAANRKIGQPSSTELVEHEEQVSLILQGVLWVMVRSRVGLIRIG